MKENKSLLNIGGSRAVLAQRTESDLSRALVAPRPDAKAVVAGWTSQESSRRSSGSSTCAGAHRAAARHEPHHQLL